MSVRQISLFLENKPGHLSAICRTLAEAKVNLLAISIADTAEFGIVRMIAQAPDQAVKALQDAGFSVNTRMVTVVRVPDHAGGIASVLDVIEPAGVNIEYLYAFASHSSGPETLLVFRFDDAAKAERELLSAGMSLVSEASLTPAV